MPRLRSSTNIVGVGDLVVRNSYQGTQSQHGYSVGYEEEGKAIVKAPSLIKGVDTVKIVP